MTGPTVFEPEAPRDLSAASLAPRGPVHPSPIDWRDHVMYFLLPDRFSDGGEAERPLFDRNDPHAHRAPDPVAWAASGVRFPGGYLLGLTSMLAYLRDLVDAVLCYCPV